MKKLRNSSKKVLAGAMVMGAFATGVFASPVNTSTAGCFRNDADNIQNVTEWSTVNFDKLFLTANYYSNYLDVVGAYKLKDITIVPFYYGNIFNESYNSTATSIRYDDVSANIYNSDAYTTNNSLSSAGTTNDYNTPGVLIGMKNMGFKFSFNHSGTNKFGTYDPASDNTVATNSTTVVYDEAGNQISSTTTEYKKGKIVDNTYSPNFQFGMNMVNKKYTLKPVAGLALDFSSVGRTAIKEVTSDPATLSNTVITKNYRNNTLAIKPNFGVTMVVPKDKLTQEFSATYNNQINMYGASYKDAFDAKQTKGVDAFTGTTTTTDAIATTGTVTKTTTVAGTVYDFSSFDNNYGFGYKVTAPITKTLTLSGKANISGSVNFGSTKNYTVNTQKSSETQATGITTTTETSTTGASTLIKSFSLSLYPSLAGGFEYFVKPGKFAINGGTSISLPNYSCSSKKTSNPDLAKTTKKVSDSNGNVTEDSTTVTFNGTSQVKKEISSIWGSLSANIYTGFSWYLADNFVIDTSLRLNGSSYGLFGNSINAGCTLKL